MVEIRLSESRYIVIWSSSSLRGTSTHRLLIVVALSGRSGAYKRGPTPSWCFRSAILEVGLRKNPAGGSGGEFLASSDIRIDSPRRQVLVERSGILQYSEGRVDAGTRGVSAVTSRGQTTVNNNAVVSWHEHVPRT